MKDIQPITDNMLKEAQEEEFEQDRIYENHHRGKKVRKKGGKRYPNLWRGQANLPTHRRGPTLRRNQL